MQGVKKGISCGYSLGACLERMEEGRGSLFHDPRGEGVRKQSSRLRAYFLLPPPLCSSTSHLIPSQPSHRMSSQGRSERSSLYPEYGNSQIAMTVETSDMTSILSDDLLVVPLRGIDSFNDSIRTLELFCRSSQSHLFVRSFSSTLSIDYASPLILQ